MFACLHGWKCSVNYCQESYAKNLNSHLHGAWWTDCLAELPLILNVYSCTVHSLIMVHMPVQISYWMIQTVWYYYKGIINISHFVYA